MKNLFYILLFALVACNDYEVKHVDSLPDGGPVHKILISPSEANLFVDSDLPVLNYVCVPMNSADTTVYWKSNHPNIIDVDSLTGKLSWGEVTNSEIIISAISNYDNSIVGTMKINLKNVIGKYQYLDLTESIGLWVLDRNVGSASRGEAGNYYHFGLNEPVANDLTGGEDGKGGSRYYFYPPYQKERAVPGGYPNFQWDWKPAEKEGYIDWETIDPQGPCPNGWRLPTVEEAERIAFYTNPANFKTIVEKNKALNINKKIGLELYGAKSLSGGQWNAGSIGYYWTNHCDLVNRTITVLQNVRGTYRVVAMKYDSNFYDTPNEAPELRGAGIPVRCVRSKSEN